MDDITLSLGRLADWFFRPISQSGELGNFIYFQLVYDFLHSEIDEFAVHLLGRTMAWVGVAALALSTLRILIRGYRIATGQSRQPMMALAADSLRATLILGLATGMAVGGSTLYEFLGTDLSREITQVVTGSDASIHQRIDRNLAYMQVVLGSIDALDTGDDRPLAGAKDRALWFTGVGIAGPSLTGGALLLMNQIAMALFIGLGPLFVLSLLFEQTKALFGRWLYYGIGTMFSLAVLSVMVSIALKMVLAVAAAFWIGSFTGANSEGIASLALQQGGLGLVLTALMLSAPPMAAAFFNGVLGNFQAFSAFGGGRRSWLEFGWHVDRESGTDHPVMGPLIGMHRGHVVPADANLDHVKQAAEPNDFLARYPYALASEALVGGGDPLPASLIPIAMGAATPVTPREAVDHAWRVAYQEKVTQAELDNALAAIRAVRSAGGLTIEENRWLAGAVMGLRQRGITEGYYGVEMTKEMAEYGLASQWGGGHTPSLRGMRGIQVPNGMTGRQTFVPLPGGRLPNGAPAKQGPGQFMMTNERMSPRATAYQSQITGQPAGTVYLVNDAKFDGFRDGKLLDAKGPGYGNFVKDGKFVAWFRGKDALVDQARRQTLAASGKQIEWHFADKSAADATRKMLGGDYSNIEIVHTPEVKR